MLKRGEQKEPLIRIESSRSYNTTKRIDEQKEFDTTFDFVEFKCPTQNDIEDILAISKNKP